MPLFAVALLLGTLLTAGPFERPYSGDFAFASIVPTSPSSASSASVVFDPSGNTPPATGSREHWVAPHVETALWSAADASAQPIGVAYQWGPLQVVGGSRGQRLPVWDPSTRHRGWVDAQDVGPVDPQLVGTPYLPPIGRPVAWSGAARVTMYTCVELGGCAATASGLWPRPGMVAVDPHVIPLGSTVWIQGLGTFLAADTGSLVRGAHIDVFGMSYQEALAWGVQQRSVLVYPPRE
ncbi:MAG: 3D domain-containing protein [Chloroflexota bacterium]